MTRPNGDRLDLTSANSLHHADGNFPGTAVTCGLQAPGALFG